MKKILCFTIALMMLLGVVSVSAVTEEGNLYSKEYYDPFFVETIVRLDPGVQYNHDDLPPYKEYRELYCHYSSHGETPSLSATPDYIIISIYPYWYAIASLECFILGDYVIFNNEIDCPNPTSMYVYVPEDEMVYTLHEAFELYPEKIDLGLAALVEEGYWQIGRRGDMDCNGKLDIKDVTICQKRLAGLEPYACPKEIDWTLYSVMTDFNVDKTRNILDATAMQKKIAGLPFKDREFNTMYHNYYW
ncbi:MAG: hypothetical protein IJD19_02860 [Ruminococcus sp.]|nr:hypothetical protein [Ruminococcus sp.]